MKKVTFSVAAIFTMANLYSQPYEIDFAGTGAGTVVDSVRVENLNQGTSLTLYGDDVLLLNIVTGIYNNASDMKPLQVYPNPMTNQAEILFSITEYSEVSAAIYDITGRVVLRSSMTLLPGMHTYRISGLHQGTYIVLILGQNVSYCTRLISQGKSNGEAEIEHVSSDNLPLDRIQSQLLKSAAATIDMPYEEGDRLKFTGMSGNYSTVVTDIPTGSKTITFEFMDCTDADSNHYAVVKIGTQTWMEENLKTTKYNDGTNIPLNIDWYELTTPCYGWNNNDSIAVKDIYGALYNWYAVDTASNGGKNVCPTDWHVPSYTEWRTLIEYLGGQNVAGGKLKETGIAHWYDPNTGATNETGFTALPGGYSMGYYGFGNIGYGAYWWSSSRFASDMEIGYESFITSDDDRILTVGYSMYQGHSVRCIKD